MGAAVGGARLGWLAPSLHGYRSAWVRPDVLAGLAAGSVVIPQAMAYATIAGLPVQVGLYTCMVPMVVYAVLGTSATVSVSTTSTIAVLVASTLATGPSRSADDLARSAATLTVLVGVSLLVMRLFKLGALIESVSPATLTGIKTGVGLTVAAGQLPHLLGLPSDPESAGFFGELRWAVQRLGDLDVRTALVSAASIAVLLVVRRVAPALPGPLLVVVGGIALVALTDIEQHGVALIPTVPTGLPSLVWLDLGSVGDLLPGAMAIAVMSFLETVLVARANRTLEQPQVDSDRELLALGASAMCAGFAQSLPPAGGFSQSAVNVRAGARSQLAGLVTAVLAVLVALFLAPALDDLPQAVLASVVIVATIGLVNLREFSRYAAIDRAELWVAVATAAIGLSAGLLLAVAVGIALTLVLVLRQVNASKARPLYARAEGGWTTNEPAEHLRTEGVLTLHLDGGLYTGNAKATVDEILRRARGATPPVRVVIVEGAQVERVTVPFVEAVEGLQRDLEQYGVRLVLTSLAAEPAAALERSGAVGDGPGQVVSLPTVDDGIAWAEARGGG